MQIQYQIGLPETCRSKAAEFYFEIIKDNVNRLNLPREKVLGFFEDSLIPELAIAALNEDRLAGFVGFHHGGKHFTGGGGARAAIKWMGLFTGLFLTAGYKFAFAKQIPNGVLALDGFIVDPEMRRYGIGTSLLEELSNFGLENGYRQMSVQVSDVNIIAKNVFSGYGFSPTSSDRHSNLRRKFGFTTTSTMIKTI